MGLGHMGRAHMGQAHMGRAHIIMGRAHMGRAHMGPGPALGPSVLVLEIKKCGVLDIYDLSNICFMMFFVILLQIDATITDVVAHTLLTGGLLP